MTAASDRSRLVRKALTLVRVSVGFGVLSGTVSVITGLHADSLSVLAVGLGVLADVTGSAALIWRFRAETGRPGMSAAYETRAAVIVALALALVSVVLVEESVAALVSGSRPSSSSMSLIAAGISLVVLAPLARAKRRLGGRIHSRALQGDGTLSAIGAATSLLALTALVLYDTLGWWWSDRASALAVAIVAATEARKTMPQGYRAARQTSEYAPGDTR